MPERRRPYTAKQLEKEKCYKCGKQAEYQWSACADKNVWRALCRRCDFDVNRMVMEWMGGVGWKKKVLAYAKLLKIKWE